jgi:hypothetical protein
MGPLKRGKSWIRGLTWFHKSQTEASLLVTSLVYTRLIIHGVYSNCFWIYIKKHPCIINVFLVNFFNSWCHLIDLMSKKNNMNSHKKKYSSTRKNSKQYFFKIKYWNKNILHRSGEIWVNLSDPQPDHETMILHIKKIKVNYKV